MGRSLHELVALLDRSFRFLGTLLVLALLVGVLGGGTCTYSDDDDCDDFDDDDAFCDDDDDWLSSASEDESAADFRLREFILEPAVDPLAHPTRALREIQRMSLFTHFGPGEHGTEAFYQFTVRILEANADLLALPPEAGVLRFERVEYLMNHIQVVYQQDVSSATGEWSALEGAQMRFVLNNLGQLVEISNSTRLVPRPGAAPR